jgi:hypothetical protein
VTRHRGAPRQPLLYFDLTRSFDAAPGQSLTVGQAIGQSLNANLPPTMYVGLIVANPWTASTSVTSGVSYATSANPVFSSTCRRIFVCSGTGTTGTTEATGSRRPFSIVPPYSACNYLVKR